MNLNLLSNPTMFLLSSAWLDPAQQRPLIGSFERGATLLPMIESAHAGLLATQATRAPSPLDAKIAALQAASQASNATFVALTQGIHGALTSAALLVDDPALAAACVATRDALLPDGVSVVKHKYTEKAGAVEVAASRRTPAMDDLLARLTLPDGTTLLTQVDRWMAAGRALGVSEVRRCELTNERDATAQESVITGQDVFRARRRWVRVAEMLLDDVAEAAPAEVARKLVGPLKKAVERATVTREVSDEAAENDETNAVTPVQPVLITPAEPANDAAPARKVG
jgi:hypothetical protein